jgi:cell division protease FtsH
MAASPPSPARRFRKPILLLSILLFILWGARFALQRPTSPHVPYTELLANIEAGKVKQAQVKPDQIVATSQNGERLVTDRIPNMDERPLLDALERQHVVVTGEEERPSAWAPILWTVLPLLALPLAFWAFGSLLGATSGSKPMTFGRSKARLYDRAAEQGVRFEDVAGVDEAKGELLEVVRFLREPERYRAVGAHVPKGVLLVGAPGTGKTLLARAVAGESGVPFFTLSGSEFVEMFVGVGASRVRDLFEQAKERAPCIIFIDELDAVGKARSFAGGFAANEEREQTLNQLLGEMDGFEPKAGVVVLAATNRPDVLDRALLRPGRFDRQVTVGLPDRPAREAILKIHSRQVPLADDVDLQALARETPGFSGADLANLVNQAAIQAAHRKADRVSRADFENALDQLVMGGLTGAVMSDTERRVVAYHEAGHALAAVLSPEADPVRKVSIVPRGRALGATRQVPIDEHHNYSRHYLFVRLVVLLGGRTAEELVFHECTTGAEDDLRQATGLARQMVARWGMSTAIGPVAVESGEQQASPGAAPWMGTRNWSEATAALIDRETEGLIARAHDRATMLQKEHREALDRLAEALMREETLDVQELAGVLRKAGVEPVAGSQDRSAPRVSGPAPVPAPVSQGTAATTRPE